MVSNGARTSPAKENPKIASMITSKDESVSGGCERWMCGRDSEMDVRERQRDGCAGETARCMCVRDSARANKREREKARACARERERERKKERGEREREREREREER